MCWYKQPYGFHILDTHQFCLCLPLMCYRWIWIHFIIMIVSILHTQVNIGQNKLDGVFLLRLSSWLNMQERMLQWEYSKKKKLKQKKNTHGRRRSCREKKPSTKRKVNTRRNKVGLCCIVIIGDWASCFVRPKWVSVLYS